MRHSNDSIVVKWRPPVNEALALQGYVVEWSPTQDKLDLGWTRLPHDKLSTVISGTAVNGAQLQQILFRMMVDRKIDRCFMAGQASSLIKPGTSSDSRDRL